MLQVQNITFSYNESLIFKDISFQISPGEYTAVIGESGSGKSTLLKLIYGEYDLSVGQIFWKNQKILGPKHNLITGYEYMKYVSQEFDLMPFITVEENVGKYLSNFTPLKKNKRVNELIKVVELQGFSRMMVKDLSGGQKQRVALAQAIALEPEIILLDEPFSHIDNFKKQSLRRNFFKYLKKHNISCLVATHDKDDVMGFANNILVLNKTKIIQYGSPQALYKNPKLSLTASFFGEYNVIEPYGIVYANRLQIVKNSHIKAVVKHAYFNGSTWLIEAYYNSNLIYVEHSTQMKKDTVIFIKIKD